jgi:AraC family transcriptional regulator
MTAPYTDRVNASSAQLARDLRDRLGAAVDYLEAQLGDKVDLDEAARRCGFSRSHFMRLFQAAAGLPVGEYVRLRRLSVAAEALVAGRPVLETALDCGYESQAAFTRAFSRVFGVTPAAYARSVQAGETPVDVLVPYEPRFPDEGERVEDPVRQERTAFRVVGVSAHLSVHGGRALTSVPALWEDWFGSQHWRSLGADPWTPVFGLSSMRASGELEYVIGIEADPEAPVPDGYRSVDLPGGPYAVFTAVGPTARTAQALLLVAYGQPRMDPELRRRPGGWDVETFRSEAGLTAGEMRCELWVPLQR